MEDGNGSLGPIERVGTYDGLVWRPSDSSRPPVSVRLDGRGWVCGDDPAVLAEARSSADPLRADEYLKEFVPICARDYFGAECSVVLTRTVRISTDEDFVEAPKVTFAVTPWHRRNGFPVENVATTVKLSPVVRAFGFNGLEQFTSPYQIDVKADGRWIPSADTFDGATWTCYGPYRLKSLPSYSPSYVDQYTYRSESSKAKVASAMSFDNDSFMVTEQPVVPGGFSMLVVAILRDASQVGGYSFLETTAMEFDGNEDSFLLASGDDDKLRLMCLDSRLRLTYKGDIFTKDISNDNGAAIVFGVTATYERFDIVYTNQGLIKSDTAAVRLGSDFESKGRLAIGRTFSRDIDEQENKFEILDMCLWNEPQSLETMMDAANLLNSVYKVVR